MSHYIQTENNAALRNKYLKFAALTIRSLSRKIEFDIEAKDMAAFVIMLLLEIQNNVIRTMQAWEKRGYWAKADHFRREWQWCQDYAVLLSKALNENNWSLLKNEVSKLDVKFKLLKISNKLFNTSPWEGAYAKLKKELR